MLLQILLYLTLFPLPKTGPEKYFQKKMKKCLTYGCTHVIVKPSQARQPPGKEADMAGDQPCKKRWEADNVIVARVKINRNQDPDIYKYLSEATNQAKATRDLLRAGIATLNQKQ